MLPTTIGGGGVEPPPCGVELGEGWAVGGVAAGVPAAGEPLGVAVASLDALETALDEEEGSGDREATIFGPQAPTTMSNAHAATMGSRFTVQAYKRS